MARKRNNAQNNAQSAGFTNLTEEEARRLFGAESAAQEIYGNSTDETESAEGTLDQPAAAQEVHGLGLHEYGTSGQYVDAAKEDGKPFEEAVVDAQRMAIADKNYVSGLPLPLWKIPEFRTTKGREALAHEFAEESPELEKCLLTLWNKGIETMACCSGHSARPRYEYDNAPYIALKLTQRASVESLANLIADYNNEYGDAIDVSHIILGTDLTSKAFTVSFNDLYAPEHRLDMSRREYDEQRNRFFAELNERFQSLELGSEQEQEMDLQEYIADVVDRVTMQSKQSLIVTSTKVSFEPQINVGCCVFDRRLNSQLFSTEVQDALKEMAIFNEGREFELDKETFQVKNNPSLLRYQMENFGSYFGAAEQEQFAEISPRANARPTAEPTYAPKYVYPDGLLRYTPGGSDVTYFYIPCKSDYAPDLQIIQKGGKAFINIRHQTEQGSFQNETYQILGVRNNFEHLQLDVLKSTPDGRQAQAGMLNLPYASKADPQMETFLQAIVDNNKQFLDENQNFVRIPPLTRNLGDDQVEFVATQQVVAVPAESEAEVEAEADAADAFASVSARVSGARGQTLETKERFSVLGQEFDQATQTIDFAKNLNMKAPQKISVISSTDKNGVESDILISVTTQGSSRPLAIFREVEDRDDVVSLEISPRLLESLKRSNPNLQLPEVDYDHLTTNGYARFEIKKLVFSQTKGIESGEVNGANEDFALSFSALGVLIKDGSLNHNQGASRTSGAGMPNNIAISEKCIEKMLGNSPVCSINTTEPTYSQVLVSLNELNRSRTSVMHSKEPLKLQLGLKGTSLGKSSRNLTDDDYQVVMHSVPFYFSMPQNNLRRTENLNIIQTTDRNGNVQTQVYIQLKNPQTNRVQRPRAYTLVGASVEKVANQDEYVLYMALMDENKRTINVQLDHLLITPDTAQKTRSDANIASLKYLKSIAPKAFEQAAEAARKRNVVALSAETIARNEIAFSEELFNSFSDADPTRSIDIYPVPANREGMQINSFNVVSSLQIEEVSEKDLTAEIQAQQPRETSWQPVIVDEIVEQLPDPSVVPDLLFEDEQPYEQPLENQAAVESEWQSYDRDEEPEHTDSEFSVYDSEEPQKTFPEDAVKAEETPENAAEHSEEQPEEGMYHLESESVAEMEPVEYKLSPGQYLLSTLDPDASTAISPAQANRNLSEIAGEAETVDENENEPSPPPPTAERDRSGAGQTEKPSEVKEKKKKSILKIKTPSKGATNVMIALGTLCVFLVPFTAGVGAILATVASLGLFAAAALYSAIKIQNVVKRAINRSRTKYNNAIDMENLKTLQESLVREESFSTNREYLQDRVNDRDLFIKQLQNDPNLSQEQKQAHINKIMQEYSKFAEQLAAENAKQREADLKELQQQYQAAKEEKDKLEKAVAKLNKENTPDEEYMAQFYQLFGAQQKVTAIQQQIFELKSEIAKDKASAAASAKENDKTKPKDDKTKGKDGKPNEARPKDDKTKPKDDKTKSKKAEADKKHNKENGKPEAEKPRRQDNANKQPPVVKKHTASDLAESEDVPNNVTEEDLEEQRRKEEASLKEALRRNRGRKRREEAAQAGAAEYVNYSLGNDDVVQVPISQDAEDVAEMATQKGKDASKSKPKTNAKNANLGRSK